MPLTSPAFPPGPYRFVNREYLIITYRTCPAAIARILPAPLVAPEPLVKYEVIPVVYKGEQGGYTHAMFLDDEPPIAGGREIWGFPKKLASPTLRVHADTLIGTLDYGPVRVATGTMGYKHAAANTEAVMRAMREPGFLLKIIPHVDGTPRVCELVRYCLGEITLRGAWTGPAALELHPHALAPVAELPVLEIVSAVHIVADLTLELGKVVHDYLK